MDSEFCGGHVPIVVNTSEKGKEFLRLVYELIAKEEGQEKNIIQWKKACTCKGRSEMPDFHADRYNQITGDIHTINAASIRGPICIKCRRPWELDTGT